MTQPSYLPQDIAHAVKTSATTLDLSASDGPWKLARLVEQAFASGYADGHQRGYVEGYEAGQRPLREILAAEKRERDQHEDTCPARRDRIKCQCATPPEGAWR